MRTELNTPCPKCTRNTLKRRELSNGKYTILCESCGYSMGELIDDKKKGIV